MGADGARQHMYLRREAWKWHRAALDLKCGNPPEAEAPWYQFWKYWFTDKPTPPARTEQEREACFDLGLAMAAPKGAQAGEDPCAVEELTEQRRPWCDVAPADDGLAEGWFAKACDHQRGIKEACKRITK